MSLLASIPDVHGACDNGYAQDRQMDLSNVRDDPPSSFHRLYSLEDELVAVQDSTFFTADDSGIADLDDDDQSQREQENKHEHEHEHEHQPEQDHELEQKQGHQSKRDRQHEQEHEHNDEHDKHSPYDLTAVESTPTTPFIATTLADLTTWSETLVSLERSEANAATHICLTAHATALYRFVVSSVLPYVATLEKYGDEAMRDNERLVAHLVEMGGRIEELGEVYSRALGRSRATTAVFDEVVDMVGLLYEGEKVVELREGGRGR